MKKIMKLAILSLVSVLLLSGCGKKKEYVANSKRGTNYDYDLFDYLDIKVYGPNEKAVIEVQPKKLSSSDFNSESEYIAIRKILDSLNMSYIQGVENKNSMVEISKATEIKNGDLITIGISRKAKIDLGGLKVNLEPYEVLIDSLDDGDVIDLFDNKNVIFYGLKDTKEIHAFIDKANSNLPSEILDNIVYKATTTETSFKENSTIIQAEATMKDEFLKNEENPYYNIDVYMLKHNYSYVSKTETVLDKVVAPIEFNESINSRLQTVLENQFIGTPVELGNDFYVIDKVGNVQQSKDVKGRSQFDYTVTFIGSNATGNPKAFRVNLTMYLVNDEFVISNIQRFNNMEMKGITEKIQDGYVVKAQIYYEVKEEVIPEETTTPTETPLNEETKTEKK